MAISKITDSEISERLVEALPTRPNAPVSLGGKGYNANELKAAFDALPLLIAQRYNALIDGLQNNGGKEFSSLIETGIKESFTLEELFASIKNSSILDILLIDGEPLTVFLTRVKIELANINAALAERGAV